ncbi:MAG: hypothetical protein RR416_02450 [Clostridia bacterium]
MKKKMVLAVSIAILVVLCSCMFMACTQDPTKVEAKYKDKGYTVLNATKDGKGIMTISKGLSADGCIITFFETEDKAKVAEADAKKIYDSAKEDKKDTTFAYKRSGNAVAIGNKSAVKIL